MTRLVSQHGASVGALVTAVMTSCLLVSPLGEFEEPAPNTGGASGKGGSNGSGGRGGTAGTGAGGSEGGQAGRPSGGADGTGGTGGAGECTTNADCTSEITGFGRCRDRTCVPLRTDECFLVEGNAEDDDAVFLGAFASFYAPNPGEGLTVYPLRLAVEELNQPEDDRAPGLNGAELALVICDNSSSSAVDRAMSHLARDVGVAGVLATLKPRDLVRAFENHPDLLYLSPIGRTSEVDALNDELDAPLVWNLLGRPSDYTAIYVRLLSLVETYVREKNRYGDLEPVKLALVVDDADVDAANFELGETLRSAIRFNGATTVANGDHFLLVRMARDTRVADAVEELWNFVPDIVVSASGSEFTKAEGVLWSLENEWASSTRPFYVLSPYNAGDLSAVRARIDRLADETAELDANSRFIGVSIAGPENPNNQNAYAERLQRRFPRSQHPTHPPDPDTGNYYDAAYFLAYAAYAAGLEEPLTGARMAAGLARLVDPNGAELDVGPGHGRIVLDTLDRGDTVELFGTLGPPDFTDGYRRVNTSVYCFEMVIGAASLRKDVLTYASDDEFRLNPLWSAFPCFPGFYE
jgi:hypothetical protein